MQEKPLQLKFSNVKFIIQKLEIPRRLSGGPPLVVRKSEGLVSLTKSDLDRYEIGTENSAREFHRETFTWLNRGPLESLDAYLLASTN